MSARSPQPGLRPQSQHCVAQRHPPPRARQHPAPRRGARPSREVSAGSHCGHPAPLKSAHRQQLRVRPRGSAGWYIAPLALAGCGGQRAVPPRGARRGLPLVVVRERVSFNSRAKQRRLQARLSPAVFSRFPGCPACQSLPRRRPLGSSSSALVPGSRFSRSVYSLPRTYNGTGNLHLLLVLSK